MATLLDEEEKLRLAALEDSAPTEEFANTTPAEQAPPGEEAPPPQDPALAAAFERAQGPDITDPNLTELGQSKVPTAPVAVVDPNKALKASKQQQLVEAINASRQSPEAESPDQMHSRKAAQAFYAMSQGKSLPDSFFAAPPVKDTLVEDQRRHLQAQTANLLNEPKVAAGKAAVDAKLLQDQKDALAKQVKSDLENKFITPEQADSKLAQIAVFDPKDMLKTQQSNTLVASGSRKEAEAIKQHALTDADRDATRALNRDKFTYTQQKEMLDLGKEAATTIKQIQAAPIFAAATTLDRITNGGFSQEGADIPPAMLEKFQDPHRLSLYFNRLPGWAASKLGKGDLAMTDLLKGRRPSQLNPEEKKVYDAINHEYDLAELDASAKQMQNAYQRAIAAGAVTANEEKFVNAALNKEIGATPAQQVAGLRVMFRGIVSSVENAYAPLEAAGTINKSMEKVKNDLYNAPGAISPNHPLMKKFGHGRSVHPADEEVSLESLGADVRDPIAPPVGEEGIAAAARAAVDKYPDKKITINQSPNPVRPQRPLPTTNTVVAPEQGAPLPVTPTNTMPAQATPPPGYKKGKVKGVAGFIGPPNPDGTADFIPLGK
jgi:hypothetical protein